MKSYRRAFSLTNHYFFKKAGNGLGSFFNIGIDPIYLYNSKVIEMNMKILQTLSIEKILQICKRQVTSETCI